MALISLLSLNSPNLLSLSKSLKPSLSSPPPLSIYIYIYNIFIMASYRRSLSGKTSQIPPVDYLRAYISDLGDHRALEQLRRILRLLTELKVFSVSPPTRLLELRHTLEKIVCHNSTDALRHVFASRIMEIKDSPQWNRLSFVSCACNRLVLMDESLQLLPAVETLDLSRNKFAKVDNLRKCTKLKHLDLGFNHLRSVAPLCEISCYIVNLVLRNNALTTLHGLENLKSLEALDVSYNIISNFSELEFLTVLPCLRNLWLEGNPLCGARWYRAQVFGYVVHPEACKRVLEEANLISRRQKRPVSFEFYSPAIGDDEGDGNINWKRRKVSRLASIANKEETMCISSDQESPSCDNEIQRKEENDISDDEGEIVDLINRVELMKKEHSTLWLREFKDWMDHESENNVDCSGYCGVTLHHRKENHPTNKSTQKDNCDSSRDSMDELQASGDETSTNIHKPDSSFVDTGSYGGVALPGMGIMNLRQKHQKSYLHGGSGSMSVQGRRSSQTDSSTVQGVHTIVENGSISLLTTLSSPADPRSPPHYEEDILQRRNNLVEEILQLSAESYSVASSNSNTSSSDDDIYEFGDSSYEADKSQNEQYLNPKAGGQLPSNPLKDEGHRTHHGNKLLLRVIFMLLIRNSYNKFPYNLDAVNVNGFSDDFIENYFNEKVADSRINESCRNYMRCDCVLEPESMYREREVVLLLSSEDKLYVLLIDEAFDGSGSILSLLGWHRVEDVREVLVGIGLQVMSIYIERGATYLFLTRSIEKSRKLLHILQVCGPCATNNKCLLRSLEQVQVELFEQQICRGLKLSIFQYSMVHFWHKKNEEDSWLPRSLFVSGGHVLLCVEDLKQFGSSSRNASSPPYFLLDSCCSISDVSELVIEARESWFITIVLQHATKRFCLPSKSQKNIKKNDKDNEGSGSLKWKLKWSSKENLFNFVALLRAIHAEVATLPMIVTYTM
ncbi:Binding protein [Salix suchowensis]|nr:Binding protein [Salix suchowensis]